MTIADDLKKSIKKVTKDFTTEKRKVKRERRLNEGGYSRASSYHHRETFVKEATFDSMKEAYMKASANNTLPAKLRQVMYALRPLVQEKTSRTFQNNTLLNYIVEYLQEYPSATEDWDIVFDARGTVIEPHTGIRVPLGTLETRGYINEWTGKDLSQEDYNLPHEEDTKGPINRYQYILFIEKEGFNELWQAVNLSERYDLAIMSTKGMSTTASRMLIEKLSEEGATIFVMHDFDKSGFSILNTLRSDTDRWQYRIRPNVIDFGFRLEDIDGLQREEVFYNTRKHPKWNLKQSGATEEEIKILVQHDYGYRSGYSGERVELNAMMSDELVNWLEAKLKKHGVKKYIPDNEILEQAYKKMHRTAFLQKSLDEAAKSYKKDGLKIPDNFDEQVKEALRGEEGRLKRWEEAIWEMFYESDPPKSQPPKEKKEVPLKEPVLPNPKKEPRKAIEARDLNRTLEPLLNIFFNDLVNFVEKK